MITDDVNKLVSKNRFNQTAIKLKPKQCNKHRIVNLLLTSDSVVGKAVIATDRQTHHIEIEWGDGQTSRLNIGYASHFEISAFDSDNGLQAGTYEFYHRYDVTYVEHIYAEGVMIPAPMDYEVNVKTIDFNGQLDVTTQNLRIEPSYQLNFYQLMIGLKNKCDGGGLNEFTISLTENGEILKEWEWHPSDDFIVTSSPTYRVPDSQISQVFTVSEPQNPHMTFSDPIRFNFIEFDRWYNDKGSLGYGNFLGSYINGEQESASGTREGDIILVDKNPLWDSTCDLMFKVDWEINLLVPMPASQPVLFSSN
ncbi:hypothetical protein Q4574_01790 [Aliiglaciecola sp. 3_MG-2023]|uniref:hypothetical protein n=1 Tax=Aliiglaciecola sp. 3_MG-2023 TaxID=3062644 RepID=UPI0026E3195E|nr:hypothetical protein [Aliiglaciecola sp. 3_MG-2023]MDO6691991.1 hypothetical protein [Aliiglaciecola sp. 3_MG-2023]